MDTAVCAVFVDLRYQFVSYDSGRMGMVDDIAVCDKYLLDVCVSVDYVANYPCGVTLRLVRSFGYGLRDVRGGERALAQVTRP